MTLTERDLGILRHLGAARWLSTRQVAALCFSGVSHSMVCRRLRRLRRARYIRSVQENPMTEALHTLGARGRQTLRAFGWERRIPPERYPPINRQHFLGINDIRIAVLRSTRHDDVLLHYFFASWELATRGWPFSMVPDAVCEVEHAEHSATAIFEYDRATEGVAYVIERKFRQYAHGLDGFSFSHVITVVESAERRKRLADYTAATLRDPRFSFLVRPALACWSVRNLFEPAASGGSRAGSHG